MCSTANIPTKIQDQAVAVIKRPETGYSHPLKTLTEIKNDIHSVAPLTTIAGTGTFVVASRAESKVWIVDEATLTAVGDFPIEGEGRQMVAFR